jgi:hypothetical protein
LSHLTLVHPNQHIKYKTDEENTLEAGEAWSDDKHRYTNTTKKHADIQTQPRNYKQFSILESKILKILTTDSSTCKPVVKHLAAQPSYVVSDHRTVSE